MKNLTGLAQESQATLHVHLRAFGPSRDLGAGPRIHTHLPSSVKNTLEPTVLKNFGNKKNILADSHVVTSSLIKPYTLRSAASTISEYFFGKLSVFEMYLFIF